ncbi:PfkB family carbohydrate kinase [Schaalia sp. Marseille-Q2122]|uniref:PfkB family carbohydrate kinase n=1 Tax=Schaalia sp. Marseille-Q2122 TaxID=2736604 RepID=UPI00158E9EB2|nr:PfkB family carbohydrate kinase [Schaalia sp. Marseille-Q2122]
MRAVFSGLTTVDVIHRLDHVPDPTLKVTSTDFTLAAGGPATNAAVAYAALDAIMRELELGEGTQPILLTALGSDASSNLLLADLQAAGVHTLDATDCEAAASDPKHSEPATSSIIEHPEGRMVASTNARVGVDVGTARMLLNEATALPAAAEPADAQYVSDTRVGGIAVVLIDGHNPALADLALRLGTASYAQPEHADEDPFAALEDKPAHLRILDGGSWKPWLTPLLGFVDVAVLSADFLPPLVPAGDADAIAAFLRGFGITRTIRTNGPAPVQWWWDGESGEVPVPRVNAISTMGAGDIFHGAFAWALAQYRNDEATPATAFREAPATPVACIEFASRVAALSTTHFGTRSWREDPALRDLVNAVLSR